MSDSENKRNAGGNENDPRRQISRSERGWQEHLARAENEAGRFLGFYTAFLRERAFHRDFDADDDDRLDTCALAMGWRLSGDGENPTRNDNEENASNPNDEFPFGGNDFDAETPSPSGFPTLYSLHNLPECIAISALFRFAKTHYARIWKSRGNAAPAAIVATLADTLANAQRDMMLAIDAENAMEYGLAICLMKKAHVALNQHFAALKNFHTSAQGKSRATGGLEELRTVLMDLRDICLRIIRDARAEMERHPD